MKVVAVSTPMCRFVGRRVVSVEMRAVLTGVREAPRHEIAGAVR